MRRYLSYIGLFVVVLLLQVYLFDNISLGIYFHPLVYVAFIILLPLKFNHGGVVVLSALMGLIMDLLTGMAGLNVLALTTAGFVRPMLVKFICGYGGVLSEPIPMINRVAPKRLLLYIVAMVAVHSGVYFLLESLSVMHLLHTLMRLVVSGAVAVFFVWIIVRLFIDKIMVKL